MTTTPTLPETALGRLEQMEALYHEAGSALDAAETAVETLARMEATMYPLMAAYDTTWVEDREAVAADDPDLEVTGEDAVWDLHCRQHELMTSLMRMCSRYFAGE